MFRIATRCIHGDGKICKTLMMRTCKPPMMFARASTLTPEQEELEHHKVSVNDKTKLVTFDVKSTRAKHSATVVFLHGLETHSLAGQKVCRALGSYENLDHVKFILPTADVRPVTIEQQLSVPSVVRHNRTRKSRE